jgi:copper chaperone CopZ
VKSLTLHIEGMSCGHCLNAVNQALSALPGVEIDSVQIGRAVVRYDEAKTEPARIAAVVADAGYAATAGASIAPV